MILSISLFFPSASPRPLPFLSSFLHCFISFSFFLPCVPSYFWPFIFFFFLIILSGSCSPSTTFSFLYSSFTVFSLSFSLLSSSSLYFERERKKRNRDRERERERERESTKGYTSPQMIGIKKKRMKEEEEWKNGFILLLSFLPILSSLPSHPPSPPSLVPKKNP